MMSNVLDTNQIRQYLLGRLDDNENLEKEVSQRLFLDDGLSEQVDAIEDEIIEEYLEGTLNAADRQAVTGYFLRSRERREKLRFNQLLRRHFESQPRASEAAATPTSAGNLVSQIDRKSEKAVPVRPRAYWQSPAMVFGQLAALVLLSALSLTYISSLHNRQALLEASLGRERANSAERARQTALLQPAMVALTLVSDRSRDASAQIPKLPLKGSTDRLIVEIALPAGSSGSYDVHLESKEVKSGLWSAKLMPIVSPQGDARLVFDVPTRQITPGIYSFVVAPTNPSGGSQRYYDFAVQP